jgi:hypothetical protein
MTIALRQYVILTITLGADAPTFRARRRLMRRGANELAFVQGRVADVDHR